MLKIQYVSEINKCLRVPKAQITQAEINNRNNVDPTLDTNFRLSKSDCRSVESLNDNDVLRWYNTSFQYCINTGNQHIFNAGCQHF